jgi:tetratricopeptide (TPR) repeat protein
MDRGLPFLACAALGALPAGAAAQSTFALGRENAAFARLLYENGYADLAAGLCGTITADASSEPDLLAVEALSFDLRVEEIRRDPNLAGRAEALRTVIEEASAFQKQYGRASVAEVVRSNLSNLYREYAGSLNAAVASEQDPGRRAALIEQGEQVFGEGERMLGERIERFYEQLEQGSGNLAYAERQLLASRFSLPRMEYLHSQLYAEGSPEREQRLETALEQFRDFGFDYPDTIQNYQGIIYQGLCHEALGVFEDALIDYEDAVALRELFLEENGMFLVGPEEADLISGASLQRVKLLTRLGRNAEAIAAADDFLDTIPDAIRSSSGPEVLAAKAQAEIDMGDFTAASASAQALVDLDPQGWAGRTGRDLMGRMPIAGLSADSLLRIAETAANQGEFSRALDLLRQAREASAGSAEVGAAAFYLTGRIYASQQRVHEAALAYDLAQELYPQGARAPEALNAAVNAYRDLARKERTRYFAGRADQRMNALAQRYPEHPLAAQASIWQGLRSEDEGDFTAAIDFYTKISPSSASYHEATFRLANAFHQQARKHEQAGQADAAKPFQRQAEEQYRRSMDLLAKAREATLDAALQQRYGGFELGGRLGLAKLLLDLGRGQEVMPLLEGVETAAAAGPEVIADVWGLRIRALEAGGRLEEATGLFEAFQQASPEAPGVASAAGVLARTLDRAATESYERDAKSKDAEELWRKAAHYYWLSVKGGLEGGTALRADEVSEVAQRLYVIGLVFNDVPEGQQTFVDWQGTIVDPTLWEEAARIYERLDAQAPSYLIAIERARTLAILGKITEAEGIYARLFDQNSILPIDGSKGFNMGAIQARPELVSAYLEWGAVSQMVGAAAQNATLRDRAAEIFARLLDNTTSTSRAWWQAKYFQIKLLVENGSYEEADIAVRNVKRGTSPDFDKGEFGFKDKFKAMEAEIQKKVFKNK